MDSGQWTAAATFHYLLSAIDLRRFSTSARAAVLVLLTVLAYLPATRAGWIWDDDYYVTKNFNLRSLHGLGDLWLRLGAVPQYYPVTHTSFWIEYQLWGLRPAGYHVVNILLHATSGVLLWTLLRRLAVPGAWLAAAVFALHPVHVESVAWVTERKNTLSCFFYLAALLAYLAALGWRSLERNAAEALLPSSVPVNARSMPDLPWYLLSLVLFVLALLSKSVTASLPAAVLLILWWKRGRIGWRDVVPLLPMFAMGIAMGALTSYMERTYVGAQGPDWNLSVAQRVLIAGRAAWFYAQKLVWPAELTFIYERWDVDAAQPWQWLFPLAAAALVGALWALRRRTGRGPLVAVLFFGGTLVPALGFVNLLPMRFSFVADHFQYHASIGLIALLVAGATLLATRRLPPAARRALAASLLLVLGVLTFRQQSAYADRRTLWLDTLAKNPSAWMARNNLAHLLIEEGKHDEAEHHLLAALKVKPDAPDVIANLGTVLEARGQLDEAEAQYRRALAIEPRDVWSRIGLGRVLGKRGDERAAFEQLERAVADQPGFAPAYVEIGRVHQSRGRPEPARASYAEALRRDPDSHPARVGLAWAHDALGRQSAAEGELPRAIDHFRQAIAALPTFPEAHFNLGLTLELTGDRTAAAAAYEQALRLRPTFAAAQRKLNGLRP